MIRESRVAGESLCPNIAEAVLGVFHFKMFGNIRTARCPSGDNLNCIGKECLCIYDSLGVRSKARCLLEEL